ATRETTPAAARKALETALAIARAQPAGARRALVPAPAARGHWESECAEDPAAVALEDRLALLLETDVGMRGDPRIARSEAECHWLRTHKAFASSEGA